MTRQRPTVDPAMFEQAVDWFMRLRAADAMPDDHAAWLQWIEADPAHRIAFERVLDTWDAAGAAGPLPSPAVAELAQAHPDDFIGALATAAPRIHRDGRPNGRKRRRGARRAVVAASVAACLLAVLALPVSQPYLARSLYGLTGSASQQFQTAHAEHRAALLPDGSRIEMGGATAVELAFTTERRLVEAAEGEVFYRVKHDAKRPFIVRAGDVTVTAVGTAFAVRRESGTVSVIVTEGAVDVRTAGDSRAQDAPLRAEAGQRVRFDQGRLVAKAELPQDRSALGWARGQLRFEDEPLRVVVASLNRYADKPIVLADPSLGDLHFTGTVFDHTTNDWLSAVQRLVPISVEETGDRVVLTRK